MLRNTLLREKQNKLKQKPEISESNCTQTALKALKCSWFYYPVKRMFHKFHVTVLWAQVLFPWEMWGKSWGGPWHHSSWFALKVWKCTGVSTTRSRANKEGHVKIFRGTHSTAATPVGRSDIGYRTGDLSIFSFFSSLFLFPSKLPSNASLISHKAT